MITVGVAAFQGAVGEHLDAVERAMRALDMAGRAVPVRNTIADVDALIIPGGESTTIAGRMHRTGVFDEIRERADDIPIMGTCAGCILLATEVVGNDIMPLGLMDMTVERNAFGRQRESFQCRLEIDDIGNVPAVFIRAPLIRSVGEGCAAMASVGEGIVMARQDNRLALVFHPELTDDICIHRYFLEML
ncbi:MAG: pyridoxal 5'-phosphate synthase glutaminase subunit PdxT [Thermoplasmatota archaeon]